MYLERRLGSLWCFNKVFIGKDYDFVMKWGVTIHGDSIQERLVRLE